MHDSRHLLDCTKSNYDWLIDCTSGTQVDAARESLRQSRTKFEQTWWELLPIEREEVVERLLVKLCRAYSEGRVDASRVSYVKAYELVRAGHRPLQTLSSQASLEAFEKICSHARAIAAAYSSKSDDPFTDGEQAADADEWAKRLVDAFTGITPDKVHRLGWAGARLMVGMLGKIAQVAQRTAQQHATMPDVTTALPTADALLRQAQVRSQTAAPRGRQFLFLVGAVELLYSVSNSSNQAPRDVKVQESTIVATQYQVLRLLLSRPHFEEILTPEQQQRVVDQARNTVFETCEAFHRACWTFLAVYRYAVQHGHHELPRPPTLPDAHALLQRLTRPLCHPQEFDPPLPVRRALPQPAPVDSPQDPHSHEGEPERTQHGKHPHAWKPYSLGVSRPQLSDHYARKYYSTTAQAWQARCS